MPTQMTPRASERSPDTIVLVHGFWVTPRTWEEIADYALSWAERHAVSLAEGGLTLLGPSSSMSRTVKNDCTGS